MKHRGGEVRVELGTVVLWIGRRVPQPKVVPKFMGQRRGSSFGWAFPYPRTAVRFSAPNVGNTAPETPRNLTRHEVSEKQVRGKRHHNTARRGEKCNRTHKPPTNPPSR